MEKCNWRVKLNEFYRNIKKHNVNLEPVGLAVCEGLCLHAILCLPKGRDLIHQGTRGCQLKINQTGLNTQLC